MSTDICELKAAYRIPEAWRDLELPGTPGKSCHSPFRKDKTPSFSVFADGTRFRDFATDDAGDVLDFIRHARDCSVADAIRFAGERIGTVRAPTPATAAANSGGRIPALRRGTPEEIARLSDLRGFSRESLRDAEERGFLRFAVLFGLPAWCVTDKRQSLAEFRRLDGLSWPAIGRLSERKAHCIGAGKNFPIGSFEAELFSTVAFCEGAPDLLAAVHFILAEEKAAIVAPVAMLGAGAGRIAQGALPFFTGKHVRFFPHLDTAGHRVCVEWARQVADAGAAPVDAFDFTGLVRADGMRGKDLADVVNIGADCFESHRKFWSMMP
jgi:CHC2 zinc finger